MSTPTENLLMQIQADQAHYLGILHDDFVKLTDKMKSTGSQVGSGKAGAGFFADLSKSFKQITGVMAGVVAGLLAIPAALTAITYAAMPFVAALSPSSVEAFHRELEGLKATVGEGLIPIVSYATASLREWAGMLLPTMRELKPIVDRLASAVSGFMAGGVRLAINTFALLLKAAEPILDQLAEWLGIMGQVLEVAAVVVSVLGTLEDAVSSLTYLMQGPIFNILDAFGITVKDLQGVVGKAVIGLGMLAAMILKTVGATETLGKFRAALAKTIESRRNPEGGLAAAPKDSAISGIDSVMAKMNERAFVATSGAATHRESDEILEEMLKSVEDIAKTDGLEDKIYKAIIRAIPGGESIAAGGKVISTVTDSSATSNDRFKTGREEGGIFGGAAAVGSGFAADAFKSIFG